MGRDTSPDYWKEYTNLQYVKHELIREYLNGWFPKLGLWSGRIVYFDTHAGRGKHGEGQSGSPLVAIKTLMSHSFRNRILERSEVGFVFIEHDADNVVALREELLTLGELPAQVHVAISRNDCFTRLEALLADLEGREGDSRRHSYLSTPMASRYPAIFFGVFSPLAEWRYSSTSFGGNSTWQ